MNLIPVEGNNVLSSNPDLDIVLGSAPPSPTPSPPLPALPPAPTHATATTQPPPSLSPAVSAPQPPAPHLASHPPRDALATSLQQLSGEAAFLPRSLGERTVSNTLHSGQGKQPALTSLQPGQAQAMARAGSEEAELYIPGLMSTSLFVILPTTDSLTPLIEKYLPPQQQSTRDLSGAWRGRSLEQLIAARSWRAVAEYCHDQIMESTPERTSHLLSLWSLRLQALLRLHLIDHLTTELSSLFALLPPSSYLSLNPPPSTVETPLVHPAVPFELHVLLASLHGLRGDLDRSVESLAAVLRGVKEELWASRRRGDAEGETMWRGRAERVGGLLAGVLADLKAAPSASALLSSSASYAASTTLLQALSRLHISTGDLLSLSRTSAIIEALPPPDASGRLARKARALAKVARGEWNAAESDWRALVQDDPGDAEAQNNLAVVLLFSSKLSEAIQVLNALLSTNPSLGYSSETVLFNFATLQELRTEQAGPAKVNLLRGAIEYGGESLRGSCLKLAA